MEYPASGHISEGRATPPAIGAELEDDYRALVGAAGYRWLEERLIVRMVGDDRVSFLNGLCSNDIRDLAPGAVVPALLMTEHAHVVTDLYVWGKPGELLLETDRALWPGARAQLEKFLVADDVELEELEELSVLDIEGPAAARAAAAAGGEAAGALAPWRHGQSGSLAVANVPRLGRPAFTFLVEAAMVSGFAAELDRSAGYLGIRKVGASAVDIIRIESGVPRLGVDTGPKTIALEARLQPAISFSKGCYVGQETIERATARGGLKKRLFGLRLDGQRVPESDATVLLGGKEVGRVTSAAASPRLGTLGLSILHHSAWEVGIEVIVKDARGELRATVSELPFN